MNDSVTAEAASFDKSRWLELATDSDGRLYSPNMRRVLERRGPDWGTPAMEAFSALSIAARLLRLQMERWCDRWGISETRMGVMFALRHSPPAGAHLGVLATLLRVSPRNITGLIDHLERDGLVRRVPDPADRRSTLAQLTDQGRERIDGMWQETVEHQSRLLEGFTPDELAQLRHLCLAIVKRLDKVDKVVATAL
jgi:DNA-binding MarR family transcriptional regulator